MPLFRLDILTALIDVREVSDEEIEPAENSFLPMARWAKIIATH